MEPGSDPNHTSIMINLTRLWTATECGNIWGSDPGCYLTDAEITDEALEYA